MYSHRSSPQAPPPPRSENVEDGRQQHDHGRLWCLGPGLHAHRRARELRALPAGAGGQEALHRRPIQGQLLRGAAHHDGRGLPH
eukprot:5399766-Heterocapsa_arctica.AAC.1